jgi:hypothetical protein
MAICLKSGPVVALLATMLPVLLLMGRASAIGCGGGVGVHGIAAANLTLAFTPAVELQDPLWLEPAKTRTDACVGAYTTGSFSVAANSGAIPAADGDEGVAVKRELFINTLHGERGTKLAITGKGFKDGTVTIWRDQDADGVRETGEVSLPTETPVFVDNQGGFSATVVITNPPFKPGKGTIGTNENRINAIDGRGLTICPTSGGCGNAANLGNSATDIPIFELRGLVMVTPTRATLGDTIVVQLKDFDAGCNLAGSTPCSGYSAAPALTLGGVAFEKSKFFGTPTLDSSGEATFNAVIPNGVPLGVQSIAIENACCIGGRGEFSAQHNTMTVTGTGIVVTPSTVVPNQSITIIGQGFTGRATIIRSGEGALFSIGGAMERPEEPSVVATKKTGKGTTVTADSGGNWSSSEVIPINRVTTTEGTYELEVIDSGGRQGLAYLIIPSRTLTLNPLISGAGSVVQIIGTGFPADNPIPGADPTPVVAVTYGGARTERIVAILLPTASGSISGSFRVPQDAAIPSTNLVKAEYAIPGTTSIVTTSAIHRVPNAEIEITPTSGPAGTSISLKARGYKALTPVQEITIGDIGVRPNPSPATDVTGGFTTLALVPHLNIGVHIVNVKVAGTVASTSFVVTTGPEAPAAAPADDLKPLGANLVRVWGFDAATHSFQLYDPQAKSVSDLTFLHRGQGYWISVKTAQTATLGTNSYSLSAGWNLIGWLG